MKADSGAACRLGADDVCGTSAHKEMAEGELFGCRRQYVDDVVVRIRARGPQISKL